MAFPPSPQMALAPANEQNQIVVMPHPPPPQQLSKRDKRRNLLTERLNEITAGFKENRDMHYRQQFQALQVDMSLIARADVGSVGPLEESGEEIDKMVQGVFAAAGNQNVESSPLAGKWYSRFAEEVNNAKEERDAALTLLYNKHQRTLRDLEQNHQYMTQLAIEEHKQLANTIRERLIVRLGQMKSRLLKEKEHLDIADSNALLLNPGQFSITNPVSPGGQGLSRKTRNTRQRPGQTETEDISALEGGKRKRKGAYEDDVDSPRAGIEPKGINANYRDIRSKLAEVQVDSPLYSIEKLFTEKELSVHLNAAALAATQHFKQVRDRESGIATGPSAAPVTNGVPAEDEDGDALMNGDGNDDGEPPPQAVEMERVASHLTRSTRQGAGNAQNAALNLLGTVATHESQGVQLLAPALLSTMILTKSGQPAPSPAGIRPEDADAELRLILNNVDKGIVDKEMLQEVMEGTTGASAAAAAATAAAGASTKPKGFGLSRTASASGFGGAEMARTASSASLRR